MTLSYFTIEFNNKADFLKTDGEKWTFIDNIPVIIDYGGRVNPFFANSKDRKLCILGYPFLGEKIDIATFSSEYLSKGGQEELLREINGEFLIVEINEEDHIIRVINSRFGSPIFWYVARKDFFLGSTSYYHLCLRLKQLKQFRLRPEPFYEFLNFKRIFREKTYDTCSLYLRPAHILTFSKSNIDLKAYWRIDYKKSNNNLQHNVEKLIYAIQSSIKRRTSDNKRYGLFLSGGVDARTILANFTDESPHCFTLTYSKNSRDYQVAKMLAECKGAKHTWIKIPVGHERKHLDECVKLTGAMYMTPALFLRYGDFLRKYIDVLFAGYGFDYFFQGKYLPAKHFTLFGQCLYYTQLHKINGDIVEYFIKHIPYRTKGLSIYKLLKKNKMQEMNEYLRSALSEIVLEAKNISENIFDIWEYINFSDLSRHYSYGGQLELMNLAEYRTICYDNDIYDIYLELPVEQRFDAKILREVLRKVNVKFYNCINANHGLPVKYSSTQRTFFQMLSLVNSACGSLKRKILRKKRINVTPSTYKRTWLPIEIVLRNEMSDFIVSLKDSDELDSLGIFEMDAIRKNINLWQNNQIIGDQTFFVMLIIDRFLKSINQ